MDNYKLIKKYPGSPPLGYITYFDVNEEDWNNANLITTEDCKLYPEFWEKVYPVKYTEKDIIDFVTDPLYGFGYDNSYVLTKFNSWKTIRNKK